MYTNTSGIVEENLKKIKANIHLTDKLKGKSWIPGWLAPQSILLHRQQSLYLDTPFFWPPHHYTTPHFWSLFVKSNHKSCLLLPRINEDTNGDENAASDEGL
jgi:hypothetical protein